MDSPLHIAAAADDNYAPFLAVTVLSATVASRPRACVFHLVGNDLSEGHRKELEGMARREGAEVRWYFVDTEAFEGGSLFAHVTRAAYFRISLPDLVPEEVERLLYLDSDLVVVRSLAPLFDLDLHEKTVAAVQDSVIRSADYLGLDESDGYFNSGVLLIDVRRWRELGIAAKIHDRIRRGLPDKWADQCHLNGVLAGDWERLADHWNYQTHRLPEGGLSRATLTDEAYEAIVNPSVIHFCSSEKPWLLRCKHPYRGVYSRARKLTPWPKTVDPGRDWRSEMAYVRNLFTHPRQFPLKL